MLGGGTDRPTPQVTCRASKLERPQRTCPALGPFLWATRRCRIGHSKRHPPTKRGGLLLSSGTTKLDSNNCGRTDYFGQYPYLGAVRI